MIFQQCNLVNRLDVLTNVLIGRLNYHWTVTTLVKYFSPAERALGIRALERLDSLPQALQCADTLSGGQQQRVAIAVSDAGTLAKLFAEAIENVDHRQIDGVRASGADRLRIMRFGILPQVLPVMLSHTLYYFESNTRSATILGVAGAGGIGLQLAHRIRVNNWDEVGFILIMILLTVSVIDLLSRAIRLRMIHSGATSTRRLASH